jgi:hypothetical protein
MTNVIGLKKTIPKPCFLDNCESIGAFSGERRWRSHDGERIYTWDALHGEIEVFNKRGRHIAVLDKDGIPNGKGAVKGRSIDV